MCSAGHQRNLAYCLVELEYPALGTEGASSEMFPLPVKVWEAEVCRMRWGVGKELPSSPAVAVKEKDRIGLYSAYLEASGPAQRKLNSAIQSE